MPTQKTRMNITMEKHTVDAVHRLAKLQGRPPASVVRDFVEQCYPVFIQISEALEQAASLEQDGPANALEKMRKLLKTSLKQGAAAQKQLNEDIKQQQSRT